MPKRILVAESADAVRQVIESLLRQNGYDVIGVSSAARAAEVLQFGRPDLLVTGGDLLDASQRPFYDVVQSDSKTSSMPLLVIEPPDKSNVSLPPEVVITRPIDPKDFMQRIGIFLGQAVVTTKASAPNPVRTTPIDDSFLDAALGLDQLSVTASEDMDKTSISQSLKRKTGELKATAYDGGDGDSMSDSRKVESLTIRDDSSEIRPQDTFPPKIAKQSGTGKIEIVGDQYGMIDPNAVLQKQERAVHDYDWFVDAVRSDVSSSGAPTVSGKSHTPGSPSGAPSDSQKLTMTETSSIIDPITKVSGAVTGHPAAGAGKNYSEGVEKFIDEFKKEIELLRSREADAPVTAPVTPTPNPRAGMTWEEEVESASADQTRLFTRELMALLAERIAERIIAKIDSDKLLAIIKEEFIAASRKKGQ